MSGFEVAGVLLGSFPLIISALEHYRDVAEVWGTFWKFRREYEHWIHELKVCRLGFEQNLEEFLLPLVAEDDELKALLAEPLGPKWKDPELEVRLRERLPKSYDLYLESMARIERVMVEVKKRLYVENPNFQGKIASDNSGHPPDDLLTRISQLSLSESKDIIKFQTTRIKMSLGQAKRDKLFQDLADCNTELRSLLDTSDRIAALRAAREASKKNKAVTAAGKALWQFWKHADRLFALITRAWTCDCRKFHLANLLLQHRTSPKVDFRVLFVFASPKGDAGGSGNGWSWTCQETKIDLLESTKPKPSRAAAVRFVSAPAAVMPASVAVASATAAPLTPTSSDVSGTTRTPSPTPSCPPPTASTVAFKSSFRKSWMSKLKMGQKKSSQSITLVHVSTPILTSPVQSPPPTANLITPAITAPTAVTTTATPPSGAPIQQTTIPVIITPQLTPSNSTSHEDDSTIDIINLCHTLAKLPKGKDTAPACLTDDEDTRFAINPVSSPTAVRDTISLSALLSPDTSNGKSRRSDGPRPTLSRCQRYFIALTLASSYLQLHSSPWISPRWNKREILFLRDPKCKGGVKLDQPYISRDFLDGSGAIDDDHSLQSLGIMLLELYFGTTIEKHELSRYKAMEAQKRKRKSKKAAKARENGNGAEDSADDDADSSENEAKLDEDVEEDEDDPDRWFFDMVTALQWAKRAEGEGGPDFADAVDWCLKSKPGSGDGEGKLEKWREEMFLKVVTPLKYNYDQLVTVRC